MFVGLIFISLSFGTTYFVGAAICPDKINYPVAFPYDPNQCPLRIIGSFEVFAGQPVSTQLTVCDPDDDNGGFEWAVTRGPAAIAIDSSGLLIWRTSASDIGIVYIDVRVIDKPLGGTAPAAALADEATIVVMVHRANQPPVIGGCSQ